jgi:hypothetical protein
MGLGAEFEKVFDLAGSNKE